MKRLNNQRHEQYLNQAEEIFFGANGMEEFGLQDTFAFNPDGGANVQDDTLRGADGNGGAMAVAKPDFDRTLTITLKEEGVGDTPVTLFGGNDNLTATDFGFPPNVTVTVLESNYQTVLNTSMNAPFAINGFRVEVDSTIATFKNQLRQVLSIIKADVYGMDARYRLQMRNYFSPFQQQDDIINVAPYNITIAGTTSISFLLLEDNEITFTFFTKTQIQPDNALHGRPMTEIAVAPLPINAPANLALSPSSVDRLASAIASARG